MISSDTAVSPIKETASTSKSNLSLLADMIKEKTFVTIPDVLVNPDGTSYENPEKSGSKIGKFKVIETVKRQN